GAGQAVRQGDAQADEAPGGGLRDHQLGHDVPAAGAHQPGLVAQAFVDLLGAGVVVVEDQEEHQQCGDADLGRDADTEPQHEQRGQGDLWHGVQGQHDRVEQLADELDPAQDEADDRADHATDDVADHGFFQRHADGGAEDAGVVPVGDLAQDGRRGRHVQAEGPGVGDDLPQDDEDDDQEQA